MSDWRINKEAHLFDTPEGLVVVWLSSADKGYLKAALTRLARLGYDDNFVLSPETLPQIGVFSALDMIMAFQIEELAISREEATARLEDIIRKRDGLVES